MKKALNIIGWVVLSPFIIGILVFIFKFLCYLGLIGVFITNSLFFGGHTEDKYLYQFEIQAMKDNSTYVQSRYSGDSELEYYFIREMDGRLHTGHTDADESSIVEDGGNTVKVYTEVPAIGGKLYALLDRLASMDGDVMTRKEYVYHIPEGSVDRDYEIDLE
jgi:hypothetical protein